MPYRERLLYLNLHSLKGRRVRGDLIETYKLYNGFVDMRWEHSFENTPCSNTRNAEGKVFSKQCRTNLRKHCYSNRVTNLWNGLTLQLKRAQSTNAFKSQLDKIPKFVELFLSFDE